MSGSLVHFKPGALRQMHWHTNEDEWQFVINGTVEVDCRAHVYGCVFCTLVAVGGAVLSAVLSSACVLCWALL